MIIHKPSPGPPTHHGDYAQKEGRVVPDAGEEALRVAVHTSDTLTYAGLTSLLRRHHHLTESDFADADIIVVAVESTEASTIEALRNLVSDTSTPLLLIVEQRWQANISAAVEQGVRAVLWRNQFTAATFVQALHTIGRGGAFLPPSLQGTLIEEVQRNYREVLAPQNLTPSGIAHREVDVLRLLSEGFDVENISDKLNYSQRTVKNILYKFMRRLGLSNRAHAVSYAIRSGII